MFLTIAISTMSNAQSDKEIKFGGRIMYDMATWETSQNLNTDSASTIKSTGVEFRRVRFYNSGKLYGNTKYKLQLDYSAGKVSFKDVWIELSGLPGNGGLRVGNFKEPLRLEALTSSKYMTFMERALPIAFSPERNTGALYHLNFNTIAIQAGVFREGDSYGNDKEATSNTNVTARITYTNTNDNGLLHIGGAMSSRKNNEKTYGFSVRPENHLGTKLLKPSFENVEETQIIGTEFAYVRGPLSLQGEYIMTNVNADSSMDLSGYYGQISYFITGESRKFKNSYSGFNRVKPKNNFGKNGKGALELAARMSKMDLSKVNMGSLNNITMGLNWYLNPNTRVMLNYVMAELMEGDGEGDATTTENTMQCRVQIDF